MDVFVCIGSSCHLKGSREVIEALQRLVAERGLEDRVVLKGSFCTGRCTEGVCVRVGETVTTGWNGQNAAENFERYVMGALQHE